uniref:Uncharacterized protein n=1 Tax=Nannospalax galili TaxID=1026970 RepID=A0A8C6W425_NANGA
GRFPAAWHGHAPDIHSQPRQLRTPQSARRMREGDNLHGSVQHGSRAGRDRARRRVRERFKSRPFPALVSPVLREHPCRPSSSSGLPPARPPSLPGGRRRR